MARSCGELNHLSETLRSVERITRGSADTTTGSEPVSLGLRNLTQIGLKSKITFPYATRLPDRFGSERNREGQHRANGFIKYQSRANPIEFRRWRSIRARFARGY